MKIAMIGATGRTGRLLLTEGVRRGHVMTAFTRRPQELAQEPGDRLSEYTLVSGDALNADDVRRAVQGQDAIISIVGFEGAARNIVTAMQEQGVQRLVYVSAYPIAASRPRLMVTLARIAFREPYSRLTVVERIVSESGLDWTLIRPTRLTDGPATGKTQREWKSHNLVSGPLSISRADLAAVLLDAAEETGADRREIAVSGAR